MKTIAIVSQKGGVGKSTLAVHLAALASETQKVILMDLDPQGSAMEWGSRRGDRAPDITPAHPASLAREIERARGDGYDLVVIDTAPHSDHAALQAARAADLIVVPCRPATFDLAAISGNARPLQTGKQGSDCRYQRSADPLTRCAGGRGSCEGEGRHRQPGRDPAACLFSALPDRWPHRRRIRAGQCCGKRDCRFAGRPANKETAP